MSMAIPRYGKTNSIPTKLHWKKHSIRLRKKELGC